MAEFIRKVRSEVPCLWPCIVFLWLVARRFFLNIPMLALISATWFADLVGKIRWLNSLVGKSIKLECQYLTLTKEIKIMWDGEKTSEEAR